MTNSPRDIGASVRARLLFLARDRGDDFQLVLTRFANERLLYRLSRSPHRSSFVLKGATLFTLWSGKGHRATRDVDLLGFGDPSEERIRAVFFEVLTADVEEDGIRFDLSSVSVGPIREQQEYDGVRVLLDAYVTTAKVRLQVDVGFGDAVTPNPVVSEFPVLLDFPAPQLRVYPRETVIAEKLEATVNLGLANSRMKDFYDLVFLSRSFAFDGVLLVAAIGATFERRGTPIPRETPVALTPEFSEAPSKNTQWTAFLRKSGAAPIGDLPAVMNEIALFGWEPLSAVRTGAFIKRWSPGGPWRA